MLTLTGWFEDGDCPYYETYLHRFDEQTACAEVV